MVKNLKQYGRSIVFYLVQTTLVVFVTWQIGSDRELKDRILENPLDSLVLLLLVIGAVVALGVMAFAKEPNPVYVLFSFALGVAAALWGVRLLKGIDAVQLVYLGVGFVLWAILWMLIALPAVPGTERLRSYLEKASASKPSDEEVADGEVVDDSTASRPGPRRVG